MGGSLLLCCQHEPNMMSTPPVGTNVHIATCFRFVCRRDETLCFQARPRMIAPYMYSHLVNLREHEAQRFVFCCRTLRCSSGTSSGRLSCVLSIPVTGNRQHSTRKRYCVGDVLEITPRTGLSRSGHEVHEVDFHVAFSVVRTYIGEESTNASCCVIVFVGTAL